MSIRTSTVAATIAATIAATATLPAFAKSPCYTAQEIRAMQYRQLQIELMVAALKCQSPEYELHSKYSTYIGKFGSSLSGNAQQLKAMFARQGKNAAAMDRYITGLSNEASIRVSYIEDYCGTQSALFDKVLPQQPHELESWVVDNVAKPDSASACSAPQPAATQAKKAEGTKAAVASNGKPAQTKTATTANTKANPSKASAKTNTKQDTKENTDRKG